MNYTNQDPEYFKEYSAEFIDRLEEKYSFLRKFNECFDESTHHNPEALRQSKKNYKEKYETFLKFKSILFDALEIEDEENGKHNNTEE